jgi:hypothetical protein
MGLVDWSASVKERYKLSLYSVIKGTREICSSHKMTHGVVSGLEQEAVVIPHNCFLICLVIEFRKNLTST